MTEYRFGIDPPTESVFTPLPNRGTLLTTPESGYTPLLSVLFCSLFGADVGGGDAVKHLPVHPKIKPLVEVVVPLFNDPRFLQNGARRELSLVRKACLVPPLIPGLIDPSVWIPAALTLGLAKRPILFVANIFTVIPGRFDYQDTLNQFWRCGTDHSSDPIATICFSTSQDPAKPAQRKYPEPSLNA